METITIYCENTFAELNVPMGSTLKELAAKQDGQVLAALVDNKLKSLDYKVINPHNVRFIGYGHPDGRRRLCGALPPGEPGKTAPAFHSTLSTPSS